LYQEVSAQLNSRNPRGHDRLRDKRAAAAATASLIEDARTGVAASGNDVIVKPFDPERLPVRVRRWTSRRVRASARSAAV
jgi:DNA-binding response OmpR family regulator